jgi:purine-binding chemotaxis protein CheW
VDADETHTSQRILDLAAERRREKQVVDVEVEKTLIVVFRLDDQSAPGKAASTLAPGFYGLRAAGVESIVSLQDITFLPGTPPWILGVVNVRGEIESVLDLKAVLGLGQAEVTNHSRLLIAQDGDLRSGLLVDQVADIVEIALNSISPPPTPLEGGKGIYVEGETLYADRSLVILSLPQIFRQALEADRV